MRLHCPPPCADRGTHAYRTPAPPALPPQPPSRTVVRTIARLLRYGTIAVWLVLIASIARAWPDDRGARFWAVVAAMCATHALSAAAHALVEWERGGVTGHRGAIVSGESCPPCE